MNDREIPKAILVLIGVNVLVHVFIMFSGDPTYYMSLGWKENEAIRNGEFYRLLTSMFIHGSLMHLAVNMYSLFAVGPLISKIFGNLSFLTIYFVSGVFGSFMSFLFTDGPSVGASGAIFGLVGALLAFSISTRNSRLIKNLAYIILINAFIGFLGSSFIDNWWHLGGLIAGFAFGFVLKPENPRVNFYTREY